MPKKSEQADTEEKKKALARRIRRRLTLLRCLRESLIVLPAVLSLILLLSMLAGPAWNPHVSFLYDCLPLRPAHALYAWFSPDIVIDGELGYDVLWADVMLFYGSILLIPWVLICRRYLWVPCLPLAIAALLYLIAAAIPHHP